MPRLAALNGWSAWFAAALLVLVVSASARVLPSETATVSVCFTPPVGCAQRIVEAIGAARHAVLVQAYEFTEPPILQALVDAHARGVDVRVILDKSAVSARYTGATFVANAGIPVFVDSRPAIAHNKVMIIDGERVLTGSFNFTRSADTRNAENAVFISSPKLAAQFIANWQSRLAVSKEWKSP